MSTLPSKRKKICLNDIVELRDGRKGIVKFIGPTQFDTGIWYGLYLPRGDGKNNGVVNHRKYFSARQNAGVFVRRNKINKIIQSASPTQRGITVGDRVEVIKKGMGTVRFIGETNFKKGVWFGVELDTDVGRNDGQVNGVIYFQSNEACGVFVRDFKLRLSEQEVSDSGIPDLTIDVTSASAGISSRRSLKWSAEGISPRPPPLRELPSERKRREAEQAAARSAIVESIPLPVGDESNRSSVYSSETDSKMELSETDSKMEEELIISPSMEESPLEENMSQPIEPFHDIIMYDSTTTGTTSSSSNGGSEPMRRPDLRESWNTMPAHAKKESDSHEFVHLPQPKMNVDESSSDNTDFENDDDTNATADTGWLRINPPATTQPDINMTDVESMNKEELIDEIYRLRCRLQMARQGIGELLVENGLQRTSDWFRNAEVLGSPLAPDSPQFDSFIDMLVDGMHSKKISGKPRLRMPGITSEPKSQRKNKNPSYGSMPMEAFFPEEYSSLGPGIQPEFGNISSDMFAPRLSMSPTSIDQLAELKKRRQIHKFNTRSSSSSTPSPYVSTSTSTTSSSSSSMPSRRPPQLRPSGEALPFSTNHDRDAVATLDEDESSSIGRPDWGGMHLSGFASNPFAEGSSVSLRRKTSQEPTPTSAVLSFDFEMSSLGVDTIDEIDESIPEGGFEE